MEAAVVAEGAAEGVVEVEGTEMNPLDLNGPEFLLFYLIYGGVIFALAWMARSRVIDQTQPLLSSRWAPGIYPREEDAYAIALLRGGPAEAARTLLGQLMSTGHAQVEDGKIRVSRSILNGDRSLRPIEADAWNALDHDTPVDVRTAESLVREAVQPRLDEIWGQLASEGLLATPKETSALRTIQLVSWLLIAGVGLLKLLVALSRGRTNVGFLSLLLIGVTVAVLILLRPPRSRPAQEYLLWLHRAHHGLLAWTEKRRRNPEETALMIGIYGLAAIPPLAPLYTSLQPPAQPQEESRKRQGADGGGGCGSGSSASSSSDSGGGGGGGDGGGGDGGGGCGGGGCGGCGGG